MNRPLVVIVGKPNVGKSTLFNRIVDQRIAITSSEAGTTRERIRRSASWSGVDFDIIDTGGIIALAKKGDSLQESIQRQCDYAIEEADLILVVVDENTGITKDDVIVADKVKKSGTPHILVCNKVDDEFEEKNTEAQQFLKLGLGSPICISAMHGVNTGDLLDLIVEGVKKINQDSRDEALKVDEEDLKIAILGRPNAGKSTLFNAISKNYKSIVNEVAGTTRDPIWGSFEYDGLNIKVWDTAGIRKKNSVDEDIEFYSNKRAFDVVEMVDVIILVVDSTQKSISQQDLDLMRYADRFGKGLVVFFNKWDLSQELKDKYSNFARQMLSEDLHDYSYAIQVFGSAKTEKNVKSMLDGIILSSKNRSKFLTDEECKLLFKRIISKKFPASFNAKINGVRQKFSNPPCFEVKVNNRKLFQRVFEKFFKHTLRDMFDFSGTAVYMDYFDKDGY